ncbi:hypothetical protein ABT264_35150 [Streptomyces virginiae]|uniref:hypothetical protein n=1 Tax=Streptomyces virginiae TaxID=1961 RepID=UPI00332807E6
MTLLAYITRWLDDPDGGGSWTDIRDEIRDHDQTCDSLNHAWLPRRGGVSCLSDWMSCDRCGVTFGWDGLNTVFEDCPESRHWLCNCCTAKATTCGCEPTP